MSLALSFRTFDGVRIDGPCHVTVVQAKDGKVRLAFDAAKEVTILRDNAKKPLPRGGESCTDSER